MYLHLFHRFHPLKNDIYGITTDMSENERIEFSKEIAIFVTTFATEVRELRKYVVDNNKTNRNGKYNRNNKHTKDIDLDEGNENENETTNYRGQIISYLLEVFI